MSELEKNSAGSERTSDNTRNNNGTIGAPGGVEHSPKGSFREMTERVKEGNPPNVRGVRENEEMHAIGHDREVGEYKDNEIDPNLRGEVNPRGQHIEHPKTGPNHIDNTGGTSAEDVDRHNNL